MQVNTNFVILSYRVRINKFNAWPKGEKNTSNTKTVKIKPGTNATFEVSVIRSYTDNVN